jgi:hypothetical protein
MQGVDHQLGAHVVGDRPAHDLAGEDVEDRGAVDLPGSGGVPGDVGAPQQVWASGDEPALHEVLVDRLSRSVPPLVPVADPATSEDPQQSGDPLAADPDTQLEPQFGVHPRGTVGTARVVVDIGDGVGQIGVLEVPDRGWPVTPLIETGP